MTHLVSPSTFRLGKSALWKANSIAKFTPVTTHSNLILGASSFNGIPLILKHKLRRKRCLLVKAIISHYNWSLNCRVLYMPRIKVRPKSDSRGIFSRHVLYKPYDWLGTAQNLAKFYIDQRRLKIFKFPQKKNKRINKWLTRRMLRGSNIVNGINFKRNYSIKQFINWTPRWICNKSIFIKNIKARFNSWNNYKFYLHQIKGIKFNSRWWTRRLNSPLSSINNKLSHSVSNTLNYNCNINLINIFNYLAIKQMIGFRSHQEHLWNKKFRKHRFYYDNYYDIVNSFFILSLIKNTESLLLDILRSMMPRIRKIKRFMMFLDSVLKNMPQIQNNFLCFRVIVIGKIRGGTERTKTLAVGFGQLPYQSLTVEGTTAFISYPHKYGEFGIKLIMNRL